MEEFFRENAAAHENMDSFDALRSAKNYAKKVALHLLTVSLNEKADTAEKRTYWILRFLRYSREREDSPRDGGKRLTMLFLNFGSATDPTIQRSGARHTTCSWTRYKKRAKRGSTPLGVLPCRRM